MLLDTGSLIGRGLLASDGTIGTISDFLFEEATWSVRYVLVDTGKWLAGRQVLLSPRAFVHEPFGQPGTARARLSRSQIEESPALATGEPLTRGFERAYFRHFGWPSYWMGPSLGAALAPVDTSEVRLLSVKELTGGLAQASDTRIGKVKNFSLSSLSWMVREIVVDAGHWYSERLVLIQPGLVERVGMAESVLYIGRSRLEVLSAPSLSETRSEVKV